MRSSVTRGLDKVREGWKKSQIKLASPLVYDAPERSAHMRKGTVAPLFIKMPNYRQKTRLLKYHLSDWKTKKALKTTKRFV